MEVLPHLPSASDLESRAACIADPAIPLVKKLEAATELRDLVESVRDAEGQRVFPHMLNVLLDILRNNEPAFKKDTTEYQFRRVLVEIIHRIPPNEAMRQSLNAVTATLLHVLKNDTEENAVTCMKILIDVARTLKAISEEHVKEFLAHVQVMLKTVQRNAVEYLSEESTALDANTSLPSSRSFKVMSEAPVVVVLFSQIYRQVFLPFVPELLKILIDAVIVEAPAQKKYRDDYEAMGNIWAGMAPTIKNHQIYTDFILMQTKMMSFIAFSWKAHTEAAQRENRIEDVAVACIRIMQDCPASQPTTRRELIVVLRHYVGLPQRRALVPLLEKLLNERVLLGPSLGSQESLRPFAYSYIVDILVALRSDLTPQQIWQVVHVYCVLLHNPYLLMNTQAIFSKLIFNMVDAIAAKDTVEGATALIKYILVTCTEKLKALVLMIEDVGTKTEKSKDEKPKEIKESEALVNATMIEKERPLASSPYSTENTEDAIKEFRFMFRSLLQGSRMCMTALKKLNAPSPDGEIMLPIFECTIKCLHFFDAREPREEKENIDWFSNMLVDLDPHVFQEIWTVHLNFFVKSAVERPSLLFIVQMLLAQESTSQALVSIMLRHFSDRLADLGESDEVTALAAIRLFKLAFGAVGLFPDANEPILATHLGRFIMDSFPLASKASKPHYYFHLMRALFRAIGSGGGRYELLYKEVLPLLPEMLESLNRQLMAADDSTRDLLVELCLTVPLRLTHLLPHLHYLMQPLVSALRGGPELVSQGLRTLELCIDNLIGDFLDPILRPVLRDLMEALHNHLKPLPASHHHAHTTIRILGKLGGRNRRLLDENPHLSYKPYSDPAKISVSFSGRQEYIHIGPIAELSARILEKPNPLSKMHAYTLIEQTLTVLLNEGIQGRDREAVFVKGIEGLFDALHIPDVQERAETFLRTFSRHVFTVEARRTHAEKAAVRRWPGHIFGLYLDAIPHALARSDEKQALKATEVVKSIIHETVAIGDSTGLEPQDVIPMLHQFASRFSALCFDESWARKSAGCNGIMIMTSTPEIGERWTNAREIDIVRTFLHVLKDLPHDPPRNVTDVIDNLTRVLRISDDFANQMQMQMDVDGAPSQAQSAQSAQQKTSFLVQMFFNELSSAHPVVRQAARTCIELLSELSKKTVVELLHPHRDRVLTSIYVKPLRALPYPIVIGQLDAIRYCVSLDPPLPDLTDELLRLLHETLALADVDDAQTSRSNARQTNIESVQLRVACIKLLTASMPLTDFFSRQHQTRQRVTSIYFKSLYSNSREIKEVAHEGLRTVLVHQNRLPKDLLQTGLRPILMNLADPKRLSIGGLEGLARLLMLLTNYFKVEIGSKLLDHFRYIAEPQMLRASAKIPLCDNESITKLVRLVNIFHLLPSSANIFLKDLVDAVVQTEAQLHSTSKSPFSEPLGKFVDRYPTESVDLFIDSVHSPAHMRTLRNLLQSKMAPKLHRELAARSRDIARICFSPDSSEAVMTGLTICADLADLTPGWTIGNPIIEVLLDLWRSETVVLDDGVKSDFPLGQKLSMMLRIFRKTLQDSPRIDILFEIITVYSRRVPMELSDLTRFLYSHVANSGSLLFRRNILVRFLTWWEDQSISWVTKAYFLRHILTPMILVHASRAGEEGLFDKYILSRFHDRMWWRTIDDSLDQADDLLKVEILHLLTVMVHHCHELLADAKKDLILCAWKYIASEDMVVKQTAYLLAARFFEKFETPPKFILRVWNGLLKPPHQDGRALVRQALDILAPVLQKVSPEQSQLWARTTRRLLAEEGSGLSQIHIIYQLIIRQSDLFYPFRALFIPHMVNTLGKLGLQGSATPDSRILSLDILGVIHAWEQKSSGIGESSSGWVTPLGFRESIVSYLVRIATGVQDAQTRTNAVVRALGLLKDFLAAPGWGDVSFKLDYFRKAMDQTEMNPQTVSIFISSARVLNVVCADKSDSWYTQNAKVLQKLVQKGMLTDEVVLLEALNPIVDRLLHLYPMPKEDEDNQSEVAELHSFVNNAITEGLKNMTSLRGTIMMLKSVIEVTPERIEPYSSSLMRLLAKLTKEHITTLTGQYDAETVVRMLIAILEICKNSATIPQEPRRAYLGNLIILVEKSASPVLCQFLLDTARDWVLHRRDAYPTMKDKANFLQRMATFESRGDALFNPYLELIYDIYTDPDLRRSDLTARLENAFILGCRSRDTSLRERFIDLLDSSIPKSLTSRLTYILGVQSWDALADCNWIYLALDLLLSSVDGDMPLASSTNTALTQTSPALSQTISACRVRDIVRPMRRLLFYNTQAAHDTWVSVFSAVWSTLSRKEQGDVTHHMVILLSREYHIKQYEMRPNVIQALLEGIHACSPPMSLPPHLLKYLAKTFGAWHVACEHLQEALDPVREDDGNIRDSTYDALAEVYAELVEEDMFYGLWRRRSLHQETNVAISYEQNGMWQEAQISYEQAQNKAKNGAIPFTESEYCLWEDHWIISTEKLQQWDLLYELARVDGNHELLLEAAWRNRDWADKETLQTLEEQIHGMVDVSTPRRRVYEAFLALVKLPGAVDRNVDFTRILEDAMQLSLRKWIAFPSKLSTCHIPLLQHFQQFVELQEAVQIFGSLSSTTAQNLEKKSSDLKLVLQAWRERLPNLHDDISVWSDLVAWRQNVFNAINKHYIPLIQANAPNGGQASSANTYGYRGYHETAWIINRFAHVARKHDLLDVAQASLTKIYELPNIEISEAFLKLREEARCRLQVPEKLHDGLNLINNTNLMYFSTPQKAEFYTLKGMFYSALSQNDEADQCFSQAVQLDMNLAKAWAEWGRYNDKMLSDTSTEMKFGANAVSCYLNAAGLFKNTKSRPLLTRVLWLLSIDDAAGGIKAAFDMHNGDWALWYWITLIPQLCLSLSYREAKQARHILLLLAKNHPQALFFPLRTTKEDLALVRRQTHEQMAAQARALQVSQAVNGGPSSNSDGVATAPNLPTTSQTSDSQGSGDGGLKHDYEFVDEIVAILKTAFPLLVLTLETMVDQFNMKFKPTPEEEIYRFTFMLLQDGIQNYCGRIINTHDDNMLTESIIKNIKRLTVHLAGAARTDYEDDFIKSNPLLPDYIRRLQHWRDRYEKYLDSRPRVQPLDLLSHWLTEFQYAKFDEVEVPGQYLEHADSNAQFSRIRQFGSKFELCRGQGYCYKRFVIHGHDSTKHNFAVQQPAARWCRREERVMQLFRTFNHALTRRKESRKRNLHFHLPVAVSLSPSVRLVSNDPSYVSLQDIYDQHCEEIGITREDPVLLSGEKCKAVLRELGNPPTKAEYYNIKKTVMDEVCVKMIPEDVISRYMSRTMSGPQELWRMRKAFTLQLASVSFMTYVVCITSRQPARFHVSRTTGQIYMSEVLPGVNSATPIFASSESVPFRFTPNLQHFVTPIGTEALLCPGICAIARALTKPEFELDQHLCLFARDEVLTWMQTKGKRYVTLDNTFRSHVGGSIDGVVKKAELMACKLERAQDPKDDKVQQCMQTVTNLISMATNPLKLACMNELNSPWF